MEIFLGWILIIFPGILFAGQLISSVSFSLAQKLGLQENPDHSDRLLQTAEKYVAYWDLVTMVWMPVAGVLMVINHPYWPLVALIAGAIYFDTSGREAAKILSFKREGIRVGSPVQKKFFFSTYIIMAVTGITVIAVSINELTNSL